MNATTTSAGVARVTTSKSRARSDQVELLLTAVVLTTMGGTGVWLGGRYGGGAVRSLVTLALLVAVASAAAALLAHRRRSALTESIGRLDALAEGDLSFTGTAGRANAAGAIDDAVARLGTRMRAEVTTLEAAALQLNAGWHDVYDMSVGMLEMSEATVHEALLASDTAEHVSDNIQHIASAMVQMNATVQAISGNVSQASSTANHGATQVGQASGTMAELRQASEQVQDVVKLIAGIADQTRVLALNATVEAARAGDAGRGFVVVADSVKELAKKSADAAARVTQTMRGIQDGSLSAVNVMHEITDMISQVSDNQTAISTAVEEQTATTGEVGESSSIVAAKAVELATSVQTLTTALRLTAYVGADGKVVAAHLTDLEETIGGITSGYRFTRPEPEAATAEVNRPSGVTVNGAVTTIQNHEAGTGINEIEYRGRWGHGEGNIESDGSDSYCSLPGDTATLRFVGTRVRFYGVGAQNHGIAEITVDGGQAAIIDEYAEKRLPGTMYWESPVLPRGEHVMSLRVVGRANPRSNYYWVTLDYLEIDD